MLRDLTARLRPYLSDRERQLQKQLLQTNHRLQVDTLRRRRDYAFCLFPEETLKPFLTRFLRL